MLRLTPRDRVLFLRRTTPVLLALFGVFSFLILNLRAPHTAYATAASTVNFQARLQSNTGAIVPDGYYNVEFKLYSAASGGSALWTEDYTATSGAGGTDVRIQVADGYLSTALGSITPFPNTIDWSQQLYLTMNIGGTGTTASWDGEMNPRLALTASPYAFKAGSAANASQLSTVNGSNTSTLSIQAPTVGNQTFVIQDQGTSGTFDLLTTQTANNSFVQLQTGSPAQQTGQIDVSGAATVGSVVTTSVDTASAATLSIGNTHANAISIGSTTSNVATTINGSAIVKSATGYNSSTAFQVQNAAGINVLSVDTTSSKVNITGNSVAPTHVNHWGNSGSNVATLSVSPATIGNLLALAVKAPAGNSVASISGGGVNNWHKVISNDGSAHEELWEGTVTANGPSTITAAYVSAPSGNFELEADEFTAGLGAGTAWTVEASGNVINSSSATIAYPSLTATQTNGAYFGYARANSSATAGSTSGFTYTATGLSNMVTYSTSITGGTIYSPTAVSSPADVSDAVAMIVTDTTGGLNVTNSLQVGGASNFNNNVTVNAGSSTTALQAQNASGASVFDVDTSNGRVGIGTNTPTAQLQVKNTTSNATLFDLQDSTGFDTMMATDAGKITLGKAPAGSIGNGTIGTQGGNDLNDLLSQKFTTDALGGGAISSMSIYIRTAATGTPHLGQMGIYADTTTSCGAGATDCAGTLIASTAQTSLTGNGWNTWPITATLSPNTTYWLAYWSNDPSDGYAAMVNPSGAGSPLQMNMATTFSGSMPSTFPTISFNNTAYELSIYATYAGSGSQLTADPTSNTITTGYNTNIVFQGPAASISNPQGFTSSEAFGASASVSGTNATAVGNTASAAQQATSVGNFANSQMYGTAVGYGATSGQASVAVGYGAQSTLNGISIGVDAISTNYSIAIGTKAENSTGAIHQLVIGSDTSDNAYISDTYLGSGVTDSTPQNTTLHATGACTGGGTYGCSGATTDGAGASLNIAGGIGTGAGNGGNINFQIAKPGTTGTSANSLSTVATFSGVNGSATFQNATNNSSAFQIQNSNGTSFLTANSVNNSINTQDINIGSASNESGSGRLLSDGFESGNFNLWTGGPYSTGGGSATVSNSPQVRDGKYAAQFSVVGGTSEAILTTMIGTQTTVAARAYMYVTSESGASGLDLMTIYNTVSNAGLNLYRDASGNLDVWNGYQSNSTTGPSMSAGAWHEVELDVTTNGSTGTVKVYLDGVLTSINLTNQNTGASANQIVLGEGSTGRTGVFSIDDLSVDTTSPGLSANLNVGDSLHVSGSSSFGGEVLIQSTINNTSAFQVQNASGSSLFTADTTDNQIQLGANTGLYLSGTTAYISNPQGQSGGEAFGAGATLQNGQSVAVGNGATAAWGSVAVGYGATNNNSSNGVAIGDAASSNWDSIVIGNGATGQQHTVTIGTGASAANYSIAIGENTNTNGNQGSIILGESAQATAANQLVIGGSVASGGNISDAYIGSGVTGVTPQNVTLHATGGSGSNVAGANLSLAGGAGTGSANGGNINFQIAKPGTSGSTNNSLSTVATFSGANGGATFQNATNSSNAFQVQNTSNTNLLNVDTSGGNVNLGLGGTPPALGYTSTAGSTSDTVFANTIHSSPFTATYSGTLSSLSVYIAPGVYDSGKSFQVGIYTDGTGTCGGPCPGTYIASTSVSSLASGWNTASITNGTATVTAGTKYWLSYWSNDTNTNGDTLSYTNTGIGANEIEGTSTINWQCGSGSCSGTGTTNGMPTNMTSKDNAGIGNYIYSMYASYTAGYGVTINNSGALSTTGAATFADATNSTAAFQVQNATGTSILGVDTSNGKVTINGGGTPLTVNTSSSSSEDGILFTLNGSNAGEVGISGNTGQIINQSHSGDLNLKSASGYIYLAAGGSSAEVTIDTNGNTTFKNTADSTTNSFQIQNQGGINLFSTNTSNKIVNIGASGADNLSTTVNIATTSANTQTVNIGTGAITTGTNTINIGTGATTAGVDAVTVGSANSTSSTTIKGGTGSSAIALTTGTNGSIAETANGTGTIGMYTNSATSGTLVKTLTNSTVGFQVQNATGANLMDVDTSGGNINLGIGAPPAPLGYTTAGGTAGTGYYHSLNANKFTATQTGTVSSMSVDIPNVTGGTHYQLGIYTDNSGAPNTYIASSASHTLSGGWNTTALTTSPTLTAGTTYWLVYWTDVTSGDNNDGMAYDSPITGSDYQYNTSVAADVYGSGASNGMPTSFPTSGTSDGGTIQHSIYVTFTSTGYAATISSTGALSVDGSATFASSTNSSTAFQIQNSTGGALVTADTSGNVLDVGGNTSLIHPAQLYVKNTNSANRAMILQGATGQSADLLDMYNGGGSFVSGYDQNGNEFINGYLQSGTSSTAGDIGLKDGTANNYNISLTSPALANSYTLSLPTSGASASGQCLQSGTGSTTTNTSLTFGSCGGGSGGSTNSPISEVHEWDTNSTSSTGTATWTSGVSPANIGDEMVLYANVCLNTDSVSTVTGGGVTNWARVIASPSSSSSNSEDEIWAGQVTTTGTATITVTFAATSTCGYELAAQEFTATSVSSQTSWDFAASGVNIYTGNSTTTVTFPTLRSNTLANEAYVGYAETYTHAAMGSTSGFSYAVTGQNNSVAWNTSLSANTSYTPTTTQATADPFNAVGAILIAYGGLSTSYINNSTTLQSGNFNVQASTSGSVAATLEANAAGTGDIADFKNGSGTNVATFGNTGNATFEASTNSTTALQVENSSGVALLTADTSNTRIDIGSIGTATGQLYVAGSVASNVLSTTTMHNNGVPADIKVVGNYAYVITNNPGTLTVYDVSNPASPVSEGVWTTNGGYSNNALAISGKYAYISETNGSGGYVIEIVDISNPYALTSSAGSASTSLTIAVSGNPKDIYVQGKFLYAALSTNNKLQAIDISNPAVPVLAGNVSMTVGNAPQGIFVQGRYAYMVSYSTGGFQIFDISNPYNPTAMGTVSGGTIGSTYNVYVQGRYAYLTNNNSSPSPGQTVQVIDVSNPSSPSLVGTSSVLGAQLSGISVQGRYAYALSYNGNTFTTLDVSNPASPTTLGTPLNLGSLNPLRVAVQGRYAYIADGATGASGEKFQIVDLGGEYAQQLQAGGTETGTLTVDNNATVQGDTNLQGGLSVGGTSEFNSDVAINDNKLTTGNGLNISTTSNLQTAGSLVNITNTATLTTSGGSDTANLINVSRSLTANVTSGGGAQTPTLDHGRTFGSYPAVTTQTDTFTVNGGHSNYYMVVGVFDDLGQPAPTVTYGGVSMGTPILSGGIGSGTTGVYLYGLKAPTTGTNNLVISGGSGEWEVAVEDFYNVNQTTPFANATSNKGGTTMGSQTVTTVSGDVVADFLAETTPTSSPASGQTQSDSGLYSSTYGTSGSQVAQSTKSATSTSTSMQWNSPSWWGWDAIDLKGATVSGSETVSGAVASFSNNCTVTSGSCSDASSVMSLNQQSTGASGAVLNIQNSGSGDMVDFSNNNGLVASLSSTNGNFGIQTASSVSGTAGSISIDTGTSGNYITGSVENDTFESGVNNYTGWLNSTSVAQSTTKAHGGTHSLAITSGTSATSNNWGVEDATNPAVIAGQSYTFSVWVYLATTDTIQMQVQWGSNFTTVANQTIPANTWTQVTGSGVAPSGATNELTYISNNVSEPTSTLMGYIDDFTVSSGVVAPNVTIGTTNAQAITIGNTSQSGNTTLYGGSTIQQTINGLGTTFKALSDSTSLFVVQNASSSTLFNIDSANNVITIGNGSTSVVVNGTLSAQQPGQSSGTKEVWHGITVDSGWTNGLSGYANVEYRLLPDGTLQLAGVATHAFSSTGVTLNSSNPLPTSYRPAYTHDFVFGDAVGSRMHCSINTSGVITCNHYSGQASGTMYAEIDGIISLN